MVKKIFFFFTISQKFIKKNKITFLLVSLEEIFEMIKCKINKRKTIFIRKIHFFFINKYNFYFEGVPIVKQVELKVPQPEIQSIPQPYPVPIFVSKPVPYEVRYFRNLKKF